MTTNFDFWNMTPLGPTLSSDVSEEPTGSIISVKGTAQELMAPLTCIRLYSAASQANTSVLQPLRDQANTSVLQPIRDQANMSVLQSLRDQANMSVLQSLRDQANTSVLQPLRDQANMSVLQPLRDQASFPLSRFGGLQTTDNGRITPPTPEIDPHFLPFQPVA